MNKFNKVRWSIVSLVAAMLVVTGCDMLVGDPTDPDDPPPVEQATLSVEIDGQGAVVSQPAGINCPDGACTAAFDVATEVELVATADAGWAFDRWEGACDGEDATCSLTLDADTSATAVFRELDPGETDTIQLSIVSNPGDDPGRSTNDAQEFEDEVNPNYPAGAAWTGNHENNLAYDSQWETAVLTGLRFVDVTVPQGAVIQNAYIQFTAAAPRDGGSNSVDTSLVIQAESADDGLPFVDQEVGNISGRTLTNASVAWDDIPAWSTDDAGPDQRTPDLSALVQEVVDRGGWSSGNALVFVFSGEGQRVAAAYRERPDDVPVLVIEFEPASGD